MCRLVRLPAPRASVFFQKLTVAHVVKKFPPFMKARKFIVLFIGLALSSYSFPFKHILILSVPLFLRHFSLYVFSLKRHSVKVMS